ncbi:MAG: DUF2242 domain-containing protein [Rhodoferax sp.]|uniref:DUF2242 domain-containing protein n=1 Tax=Rhodoferax sp. TaxID=50421 RepID=UPI0032654FA2
MRISLSCLLVAVAMAGCASPMKPISQQEEFNSSGKYSRMFDATPVDTCEAARRALLSQGYVISTAGKELVQGQKNFQPENEIHVQMDIRVVCASESKDGKLSLGFVTALQDRYALKKSNSSASLGVGVLGSVSVPVSSSNDAMVKVGSETVSSEKFYDRFFALVQHYLAQDMEEPDGEALAPPAPDKPKVPLAP